MKRSSLKKVYEIKALLEVLHQLQTPRSEECLQTLAPLCQWTAPFEADAGTLRDFKKFLDKGRKPGMEECIFLNLVLDKMALLLKYMEDSSDETLDRKIIRELAETTEQATTQMVLS